MDPNFSDLSAWNLHNPQQPNPGYPGMSSAGYPGMTPGGYPDSSGGLPSSNTSTYPGMSSGGYSGIPSGGFANSNTIGYPAPTMSGFDGQSGANFNNTPYNAPGGFPDQRLNNPTAPFPNQQGYTNPSYGNNPSATSYVPGTTSYNIDYASQMQSPYIAGNPTSQNFQTNYCPTIPPSGGCSFSNDPVNTNRGSVYPMFNDFPTPISSQSNEFSGSCRVYGFAESAPHEDIMEPTLRATPNFCVERDCERLKKAMAGLGANEKEIIEVMGHRTVDQRVMIVQKYKSMYGKDLFAKFKSELHSHLEDCVIALCYSPAEFDAIELRRAMRGAGTDEDALIEILCSRTNEQIKRIKDVYPKLLNGRNLEKDVDNDTTHHFKRICIALLQANRDESTFVDTNLARRDAEDLYRAGEQKIGTDESKFIHILVTRSYAHLRAVFNEYTSLGKRNMEDALKSEMHGHTLSALLSIVRCIQNKPRYFAAKLLKAMKGAGTDDRTLIRIIVSRCEVDMGQIKKEFHSLKGKTLEACIHDETSRDYRRLLLALIGA
ncbi:putative annexin [Schistosoma mansoni]|uniref:Annexin n=1 Tax=Schistosoma mansoni TaxID=6183 RepID=G4VI66_SCHMA|nr:putative annexin [Schistosoma mansoni]|eukprot:XP_018651723.1 putative annexin [Schistosoma mansoni]